MTFDRATDPKPIGAQLAVTRGVHLINWPVRSIILGGIIVGVAIFKLLPVVGFFLGVLAIPAAWVWWSYYVPQRRNWALQRGADPEQLQYLAERANLVWPKGSVFELTEFRRRGR